jgi:flagellar motility protein MotE (MotC chaperone)
LKCNFLTVTLFSFFILLVIKIMISGFYLQLDPVKITSANLAIADEVESKTGPDPNGMDLMLRKREKELDEKEMELKQMEQRLLPLKKEVEAKIEELNELQSSLTAYSKDLAEREKALKDAKIEHLVKLYTSMEANKAASIMDKLPIDTVVRILGNMKGKSAGQILAMMSPEKGATISVKLSKTD